MPTWNSTLCYLILLKLKQKFRYVGEMSNLHGINMIFSSQVPLAKRVFWFLILSVCCFGAGSVLMSSLSLLRSGVIAYSVDTNSLDWDTPFPAVTVCEQSDSSRVKAYLKKYNLPKSLSFFYKDVSYWNLKYCRSCAGCKVNETCVEDFVGEIRKIRLNCSAMLTDCWWGDELFRCCDRFQAIETEYGVCFSFNSALRGNHSGILVVNRKIGTPRLVFSTIDLTVIKIHAPDETVSVDMDNLLGRFNNLPLMANLEIILKVEQTVNDASVTSVSPDLRGCLFKEDRPTFAESWPFSAYTISACFLYCRATIQFQLCNCTHHFLSNIVKMPACDIYGLACLSTNKDEILKYNCTCPMSCEETSYKLMHTFYNRSTKQLDNGMRTSRAVVRLIQLPSMRVRRFAIRDNLGLVVDIGGVGGVFFGASLLSLIEFVYLFCIRQET